MTKRSTEVGRHACLPLDELMAERGNRSNACRAIGDIAADVVNRLGRSGARGREGDQTGPDRANGEEPMSRNGMAINGSTGTPREMCPLVLVLPLMDIEGGHAAAPETWVAF